MQIQKTWFFNDVEMTYNWKRRWARWEVFWWSSSCFDDKLESNKKDEKSERQIEYDGYHVYFL